MFMLFQGLATSAITIKIAQLFVKIEQGKCHIQNFAIFTNVSFQKNWFSLSNLFNLQILANIIFYQTRIVANVNSTF